MDTFGIQLNSFMDDEQKLVRSCQKGDRESFGVLYDIYVEKIFRFSYYKTFDKELAKDITSTTFTRALEKINTYDSKKGPFGAWLYRIARNAIIDFYRTENNTTSTEDVFELWFDSRIAESLDARVSLEKVVDFLKTLSPKQREIITLRIWDNLSYREISEIIGGTEASTKMAFSRAIKLVRETCGPLAVLALLQGSTGNV